MKENLNELKILDLMEILSGKSDDSRLDESFWTRYGPVAEELGRRLSVTPSQAVLFSVCLRKGPRNVSYEDIAHHLDISNIMALSKCSDDIDALVRIKYLRYRDARDEESFDIPVPVIRALKKNRAPQIPRRTGLSQPELFEYLGGLFDDLDSGSILPGDLYTELKDLFALNKELPYVRELGSLGIRSKSDWMVLVLLCHLLVNKDDDSIIYGQIQDVYRFDSEYIGARAAFQDGTHPLMKGGLVEHECDDGVVNSSRIHLTNGAKSRLLSDFHLHGPEVDMGGLVSPATISEKGLFYTQNTGRQVRELQSFLSAERYNDIHERMAKTGFRSGFACLFYGPPGTGKTETVYQIARVTGRSLLRVNVPDIKSKWVGESEKNIKAVFERYRKAVKHSEKAPILLFNEADSIFGVRMGGAERAVDKMENAIQNILLQEMEDLDGILIATTNLTQNLDHAFERRFLYKVRFDQPDSSVREMIWGTMLPLLSAEDCARLASAYELSGGQIENIARKFTISTSLYGDALSPLPVLEGYCKEEKLGNRNCPRIGF